MSEVKDLAQGTHEAFRALINSIAPETASESDGKFQPEALEKLSEKLRELVGDDALKDFRQQRNERGELVNEEGLPIIDIEEPSPPGNPSESETNLVIQDVPLIRLSSLPSTAREKLRLQRDRILDSLEEEEREEEEQQKRAEREEREEMRRKRMQESVNEKARLQRAKELRKKMGKALLWNTKPPENDSASLPKEVERGEKQTSLSENEISEGRKKTVSFAETSGSSTDAGKPDWGDVTAAKLRPGERPSLLQAFRTNNPLRTNVVERKPAGHHSPIQNPLTQNARDSDDESEPDGNEFHATDDNDNEDLVEEPPDSEEDTGEVELENEYDLNYAQQQREIALEYYQKRNVLGPGVAESMMNATIEKEDMAAGTPTNQPKPSVSRFKADRIASAYSTSTNDGSSASPVTSLLPDSAARTIQQAVKSGRIDDNDRLVGGGNDSDSEAEAEGLQEALELLMKGELYNLGPNGHALYTLPAHNNTSTPATLPTSLPTVVPPDKQNQLTQKPSIPPLNRPKVSKFKVDRSQAGRPLSSSSSTVSINKPTSLPSPRPSSAKSQNTLSETIVERKQFQSGKTLEASRHAQTPQTSNSFPPMIVESPSFSAPISAQPKAKMPGSPFISSVVESPSLNDQTPSRFDVNTTPFPMVIDSPSFPPPGGRTGRPERPPTVIASPTVARDTAGKLISTHSLSNQIVASTVQERAAPISRTLPHDGQGNASPPAIKVSRFKQSMDGHT